MLINSRELTLRETPVGNKLPTISTDDLIFNGEKSKGEFNFQTRAISPPELPVLDGSPKAVIPSKFPVLCAKFGESNINGLDLIILPPWAEHIHDDHFFLRFLLLEAGYKHGNIRSIWEVSTRTTDSRSKIEELAYALMALNSNRRNIPMSPKGIIRHLSKLLITNGVLTTPFATKRIVSPKEIEYFQDARRIQGKDYQRLLAIHKLLYRFRVEQSK